MGKVNVVLPGGRVVSVDQADAEASSDQPEAVSAGLERGEAAARDEKTSGVFNTIRAGAEGAADTLTLGIAGKIQKYAGGEEGARDYEERAQAHPVARAVGEAAALAAPTGWLGAGAKAVGEVSAVGKIGELGKALGGKTLGRAVEGALFGAGGKVAETNASGDPLTVEGLVQSAGVGSLLNIGIGLAGDKIVRSAEKAKAAVAEAEARDANLAVAKTGAKIFSDSPASWDAVKEAHDAVQSSLAQTNREIERETRQWDDFMASPKPVRNAIDKMRDIQRDLRVRIAEAAYGTKEGAQELSDRASLAEMADTAAKLEKYLSGAEGAARGGNFETATLALRDARDAAESAYGSKARTLDFPELPSPPRQPVPYEPVKLPASIRDFAKQRPDTISKLANGLDDSTSEAVGKLADDLGVARGAGPGETIAAVHAKLGDFLGAIDKAADNEGGVGIMAWMRKFAKQAGRYSVARVADTALGGGFLGAIGRVAAGDAAGGVMSSFETRLLDNSALEAKQTISNRIQQLIADHGESIGKKVTQLGPVLSYLDRSFPSGQLDPETDPRKKAVNRINEIASASTTAPDNLFLAIEGMLGHPGDLGWKIHTTVMNALGHLLVTAPKDPGLDTHLFGSNWTPAWDQTVALAHRIEAVINPLDAIKRTISGGGHPAAVDTLWQVYPAMMNESSLELANNAHAWQGTPATRTAGISQLMGAPLSGLQNAVVVTTIQGLYLPAQPSGSTSGSQQRSARSTGRPPAVQSPVAGSSVAGLIS